MAMAAGHIGYTSKSLAVLQLEHQHGAGTLAQPGCSCPSRSTERCCCGPEGTRGEVGSPQKEHALVGFHPWGSAGEEAQALLTTPCSSSCTDHPILQTPARATVTMASMRGASASATPSVCTTRAAAATTPPPAKPKVPAPQPLPCRAGAAGVALGAQHRGGSEGLCWFSSAPTMSAEGGQRQNSVLGMLWHWGFLAGGSLLPAVWAPRGLCKSVFPESKCLPHPDPMGDPQGWWGPTCSLQQ